jgi:hypothetical protein
MKTNNKEYSNTIRTQLMSTYQKRAETMEHFFRTNNQQGVYKIAYIDLLERYESQYKN